MDNLNRIASELQNPSVGMDRLAQYAQGTNPLIPQYMALAEIQRRQDLTKLEPGQASTTTVAQDLVSKALAPQAQQMPMGMPGMAPQQMPQQAPQGVAGLQAPQGVAALPSGMGQQSFAGGGIVAFDEGSKKAVEDPDVLTADQMQQIANRGSLQNSPEQIAQKQKENAAFFSGLKNYVPNVSGALQSVKDYMYSDPRSKILSKAQAGTLTQADLNAPAIVPTKAAGAEPFEANYPLNPQLSPNNIPAPAPKAEDALKAKTKPLADDAAKALNIPQAEGKSKLFADYEEMLKQQGEESKKDRETSKYMRLLEAGLGIMGGTSPYAFANIGQGAMSAAKGAAQDIATFRKEQRENIKDLAALGMKREEFAQEARKLDITQQHYNDLKDLGYKELDIKRMIVNKTPEQIQMVMRYASDPAFAKAFQDMSADKKTSAIDQLIMQSMQGGGAQPIDRTALAKDLKTYGINI
jgi:hypothetical protein